MQNNYLVLAGLLSFAASLAHIATIIGGASWYRFMGAGESMASMAEQGSYYPMFVTLVISALLSIWGLYAWSGADLIPRLPLLRSALVLISLVYLGRGLLGLILPFVSSHPAIMAQSLSFWIISSLICLVFGIVHVLGLVQRWSALA